LCEPPRKPADLSASSANPPIGKPIALNRRMLAAVVGAPSRASSSPPHYLAIRSRNQGSYFAIACTFGDAEALAQRLCGDQQPVRASAGAAPPRSPPRRAVERLDPVEADQPVSRPRERLLQALVEAAPDRHDLADRLHRRRKQGLRALELLEGESADLVTT
jgi:hypothetical protein